MPMVTREPGFYWVTWTAQADRDLAQRKPGPHVAHWDGGVWWFVRSEIYRFDTDLHVLGSVLRPPQSNHPHLDFIGAANP
jgi:hypothetical protein